MVSERQQTSALRLNPNANIPLTISSKAANMEKSSVAIRHIGMQTEKLPGETDTVVFSKQRSHWICLCTL